MALDAAAVAAELKVVNGQDLSWSQIRDYVRGKIAEVAINGGIASFTLNGRTVSYSLGELREILKIAEARAGGGLVVQDGSFG